jgi:hypothetical protein
MVTFNEVLRAYDVEPATVALLRHTGQKGPLGFTVHDLWQRQDGSFDQYQSTQDPRRRMFESPNWASFVVTPTNETLFVGLYAARKSDPVEIGWLCPMTGLAPGKDKGRASDFYQITSLPILDEYRGNLKIEWDNGFIAWARHAHKNEYAVVGEINMQPIAELDASPEGAAIWRAQRTIERDSKIAKKVLTENADKNGGDFVCEACIFKHSDRRMFDVHHLHPLLSGPRMTRMSGLVVLCPLCHRRAHCGPIRTLPFDLERLQEWNASGRP